MNNIIFECKNICYQHNKKIIIDNVSFKIKQREMITLVGLNGAGKSTLCKLIIGSIKPTNGTIIHRNLKMSYVPQLKHTNLIMPLKVINFIKLNNKNAFKDNFDLEIIKKLKLEELMEHDIKNLSGGELQKVFLARSLIKKPDLLVLDEPLSAVDFHSKADIYSLISEVQNKYNFSSIMVSHDLNLIFKDTTWVLCLNNGKIGCNNTHFKQQVNNHYLPDLNDNWKFYQHED